MEEVNFKDTDLKYYFVAGNDHEGLEDMEIAYKNIKKYFPNDKSVQIINISECLKITGAKLTKRHIFVLPKFSGDAFDYLQENRSLIVGPRCLISCLAETASIPLNKSPVFTTAMRGLGISASCFSVAEKAKIKSLVSWMGGYYLDDVNLPCTHLVSNTIKSVKYEKAGLNDLPIMLCDWVHAVWDRNKNDTMSATSSEFEKYRLPIFYDTKITSTGLTGDRKNKVIKLVTENGGTYQASFESNSTDILITDKDKVGSAKYLAAVKFKIVCLLPDWLEDSVTKGYAVSFQDYKVASSNVSTPTKSEKSKNSSNV